jgi:PKD repeat protein
VGEVLEFKVFGYNYDFGCCDHSYEWNFGDRSPILSTMDPNHVYTQKGTYRVKLTITNSQQTISLFKTIIVRF